MAVQYCMQWINLVLEELGGCIYRCDGVAGGPKMGVVPDRWFCTITVSVTIQDPLRP